MSDIVKILPYTVDLDQAIEKTELHTLFVMGDSKAHRFELEITQGGAALDLSGCTVTGYFINFKEKIRVKIDGKAENGKAAVTLIKPCYALHGHFTMIIQIISGDVEHSVFCGDGYMRASETETIIYDDYIIYDVAALLAQISEMKTATENANKAAAAAENPPYIDAGNNHWMAWDAEAGRYADTGVPATGPQGEPGSNGTNGQTPYIGENGNWWIGDTDTGTKAQGPAGANGTGSGTVTGVMIGDQTYQPNEQGVVTLPEQEGGTGVPDGGTAGQILIKQSDANGDAIWKTPTAQDVGARPNTWTPSASDVGARPDTWTPSASDVGARPDTWTPSASDVGALPSDGTAADAAKLGGNAPEYYMPDYGRGETLWGGDDESSWTSGSIDVPNTDKYKLFQIGMSGQGATILAAKHATHIRGVGGYSSATPTITMYYFAATFSGNTWTLVACNGMQNKPSGSHGTVGDNAVTSIVGLC